MFQERIQEHYEQLTPGFRRLADFIMNHTLDVAFLTATELARRVDVDPATVVRFSQELGYSGYRELSRELKSYVRDQITATTRKATEAEDEAELLDALFEDTIQRLERFMSTEKSRLAEVVRVLQRAKQVWVTGEGISYELARLFAKMLRMSDVSAQSFYPGIVDVSELMPQIKSGDVLIAIALDNPGIDSGYAVHMAEREDITTICFAGSGTTMPAREADIAVVLPLQGPLGIPSFTAAMWMLAIVWEAAAGKDPEKTVQAFSRTQEQMGRLLNLRAQTPEYEIDSLHDVWEERPEAGE